jgi:hypothetical protein
MPKYYKTLSMQDLIVKRPIKVNMKYKACKADAAKAGAFPPCIALSTKHI